MSAATYFLAQSHGSVKSEGERFSMPQLLLTVRQVAEMLSVKPSTVYEWARIRYIPSIQLGSGSRKPCVRFDQSEIHSWLETRKKAGRTSRLPSHLFSD